MKGGNLRREKFYVGLEHSPKGKPVNKTVTHSPMKNLAESCGKGRRVLEHVGMLGLKISTSYLGRRAARGGVSLTYLFVIPHEWFWWDRRIRSLVFGRFPIFRN